MATIPRRLFLKGLGVSIALPPFESYGAKLNQTSAPAHRFVCVAPNYGMNPGGFFPEQTGAAYVMPPLLKSLEPHRRDLTIFTNLDHPDVGGGHGCSNTLLNAVEMKDVRQHPQRLHSLDQLLAEQLGQATRFPSLLLGSGGVSWSRAGVSLPTDASPTRVFTRLFVSDQAKTKQRKKRFLDEDGSILDVVRQDARRLQTRLAGADRAKLDQFLTSIRGVERKLKRQSAWIDIAKPNIDDEVIRGNDDVAVDLEYPYNTAVMYDLIVLALQTNSTNVICYGHPGGNRMFPFEGVSLGYHSLTHHGKRPDLLKQLNIIESYYAEQFSRFIGKLKQTLDADGVPLLDSTVVLFGSGMGNASSHSSRNLPIALVGGGFRNGAHHRFDRHGRDGRPLSDLFVTILQQLGVERDEFATSTGNLNELLT
ncbi:MAG: DUF1552 domain-containing protein [Pirellulaceae bacterium]|jgi:hypothetical protein|nr:DUF1552 domain-containing protein [Pirellulaceae bacterium]